MSKIVFIFFISFFFSTSQLFCISNNIKWWLSGKIFIYDVISHMSNKCCINSIWHFPLWRWPLSPRSRDRALFKVPLRNFKRRWNFYILILVFRYLTHTAIALLKIIAGICVEIFSFFFTVSFSVAKKHTCLLAWSLEHRSWFPMHVKKLSTWRPKLIRQLLWFQCTKSSWPSIIPLFLIRTFIQHRNWELL